ncbi:glycosyltransferase family 2 protein [Wenyingzhuangia sp. 2_MG-2023]|uniref:glycosyltransferase family 2 protein n=1 Tax=Wenyingzhuangia sp. 2_MG-2023 TaxID=3062639 RepID=UPI0026E482DF|nr:glycosyltransferase family 2 protein [Wenyingzhuangia sp. 2_MG-2023]MDO6738169.1 glycosyltransferase family 2 protein [Wenyingzhuangia sp. 2_MG-2023]
MNKVIVIIPAFNEDKSIANVIKDIPLSIVNKIIVVNNNSTDNTAIVAKNAGATVLLEPNMGYGYACLKGIQYIAENELNPDIIVFLDGDYSDYPEQIAELISPITTQNYDFVVGSRNNSQLEKGAMTPQQIFGNGLATFLMRLFFKAKFTDLGPFRAIKYSCLLDLQMEDKTYGWTIEMQLKAIKKHLKYIEIPVRYRKRIGVSKVSGTVKGTIFAGIKILTWIFKYSFK